MKIKTIGLLAIIGLSTASAASVSLTFTELTGVTGGSPAGTAVFRASLAGLGLASIQSITITDNSFGIGGSTGEFSGFDLDGIKLSNTSVATAAAAQGLVGLAGLNFGAGTLFTPGAQRAPVDAKLFGTGAAGNTVNNGVATLSAFDANSTTDATAAGFISMGDGGQLVFNLAAPISTTSLYLYLGEVGDNGELIAGSITISDVPVSTPDGGTTVAMLGCALSGLLYLRRKLT